MDSVKILEFSDYKGEYENGNLKKAAKANLDLSLSKLSREKKLELKSYKFKCYEKIDSIETESAEEIDGETIIITSKEIGKITITYKKNGRGEVLEKSETVTFFKVKDKWYLGTANAHASSDVALRLLCILGCVHEVRSASAASQLLPAYVAPSIRY